MKAFVIEDNSIDLKLLAALLLSGGHELISFASAEGALEEISAQHPDVVLLDLNLAGKDGLELARAMRAIDDMKSIPVLAITAYPQLYTTAEIFEAGCSALIVKPVDTRSLIGDIQTLCARTGGRANERPDSR